MLNPTPNNVRANHKGASMKKVWLLMNDDLVLGAYSNEFKAERAMFRHEQDDEAEGDFIYYTIQEAVVDEA